VGKKESLLKMRGAQRNVLRCARGGTIRSEKKKGENLNENSFGVGRAKCRSITCLKKTAFRKILLGKRGEEEKKGQKERTH